MASLKRFRGNPYWYACFSDASGKRVQQSTGEKERGKASAWLDAKVKAVDLATKGLFTETRALRWASDLVEETTGAPLRCYTAETWLREWLDGKLQARAEGTGAHYAPMIEGFIQHLGRRATLNIAHITTGDFKTFRDAQINLGKSPGTCNQIVSVIGSAFIAACDQGLIPKNPASALDSLPHRAQSKEPFTDDQLADLLEAAPSVDWRGAILFAFFTGARLSDVANMKWDSVNLAGKLIQYTPQKTARTGRQIKLGLHRQLEAHLMSIAGQDNPQAFLFPTLAGRGTGGAQGLSTEFAGIMAKAGITSGTPRPRKGAKGRTVPQLSFHSFRHGCVSAMANNGIRSEIREAVAGHTSARTNKIYTHFQPEALRHAVDVIPDIKVK